MTEPITCGLGLCSAGIVESFNQFRDFIALICIIGLMSFRFSFGFYRFTLLLILFYFLFFQDLSENHPSQEPMGPCSSERVSWLKIKRLKKKILGSLSGNRGRPAAPEVSLRVANKSVRETNRRGKQREKK